VFAHNQAGHRLNVRIRIYAFNGQQVADIQKTLIPDGFHNTRIHWDGTDNAGHILHNGMYIYQLLITNENSETKSLSGKILIIR
jgi:flagellar hook assembly protein FlgD